MTFETWVIPALAVIISLATLAYNMHMTSRKADIERVESNDRRIERVEKQLEDCEERSDSLQRQVLRLLNQQHRTDDRPLLGGDGG